MHRIMKRGELRVVTLNSPTCYYLGAQGEEGFEFQLASRFAHEHWREARYVPGC